jgi:hypothetical protein
VSNSLLWRLKPQTLGERSLKKIKAARRVGWALVDRMPKTAPQSAVFCHPFTGTETYMVSPTSFVASASHETGTRGIQFGFAGREVRRDGLYGCLRVVSLFSRKQLEWLGLASDPPSQTTRHGASARLLSFAGRTVSVSSITTVVSP